MNQSPLIVIVGQTASGKSELALRIAEEFDGEIICADSRTVYTGMDIGTAKPSPQDQKRVRHHLLDVVRPDQQFTVADFKRLTDVAIIDITNRGKLPILVGGSGLYINAVIFDYRFPPPGSERDTVNPRHTSSSVQSSKAPLRKNTLLIGVEVPEQQLKDRIRGRVDSMVEQGFLDELGKLMTDYGPAIKPLKATGYKAFQDYIENNITLQAAKDSFARNDYLLAKKQRTWFKRNTDITWFNDQALAFELAKNWLLAGHKPRKTK